MTIVLYLLVLHFIGDFVLQSNWMATNKSKDMKALTIHVGVYALTFWVGLLLCGYNEWQAFGFWAMTFVLHWIVDAVTSRITTMLWFMKFPTDAREIMECPSKFVFSWAVLYKSKRHWFFVAIGADQLIHTYCLAWAAQLWLK